MKSIHADVDVVVIGGGIAGLATAFYLLDAGRKVLLIEQKKIGQEASWAGGGILSPLKPWRHSDWHNALTSHSLECLKIMSAKMNAVGFSYEHNQSGLLYVNDTVDTQLHDWVSSREDASILGSQEAQLLCESSNLSPEWVSNISSAVWMPGVGNIRNPRFLEALKQYLLQHPDFSLHEDTKASLVFGRSGQVANENQVFGVELLMPSSQAIFMPARTVVVTAGAWSTQLLPSRAQLEIKPIRGQMLLFKPQSSIKTIIMDGERYIIPRADGSVLVGSTVENVGFDKNTTTTAKRALHQFAAKLIPELETLEPVQHWCGLRPVVEGFEGVPLLGQIPGLAGLWINSGHYRNGIVHAAGSAQMLVDGITGREPVLPMTLSESQVKPILQDPAFSVDIEEI